MESHKAHFNEDELRNEILQSLKRRADVDDLTFNLCNKTGWDWKKSSEFVASIQRDHGPEIEFLWLKIFSILGIVCVAIGILILFYFFDVYVGWNNVASCFQQSFHGQAAAASSPLTVSNCLSMTLLGFLGVFGNHYGYIAITLIIGGFAGLIIAQRQMKTTLNDAAQVGKEI